MKFWRMPLVIVAALILGWTPQDANAQAQASTFTCVTITITPPSKITGITANKCPSLLLHSGGHILIHSRGKLACHSC